jgi:N-acetylneuraminic acid mutarotase
MLFLNTRHHRIKGTEKMDPPVKRRSIKTIIFLALVLFPITLQAREGLWVTKEPAPTKRTEVAAVSVRGKVYVIGGFGWFGVTDIVEEYDPERDSWKIKAPLPEPLHHVGAAVAGGKVYVIGGFGKLRFWKPVNSVYEYDPAKDSWTEKTSMPTARGALSLGVLNGKIYAIGGRGEEGDVTANEVYDPSKDTWEVKRAVPNRRKDRELRKEPGRKRGIRPGKGLLGGEGPATHTEERYNRLGIEREDICIRRGSA